MSRNRCPVSEKGIVGLTGRELADRKRSRPSRGAVTPFSKRGGAVRLEDVAAVQMAVKIETAPQVQEPSRSLPRAPQNLPDPPARQHGPLRGRDPWLAAPQRKRPVQADRPLFVGSGRGTRTPDTWIMIPLL